jgi:hypothetical protein
MTMRAASAARSSFGRSEQRSFEMRSGRHERLAVERRTDGHVVRDVRDRHGDDEAACVFRIGVGLGEHRVVVVLGVDRIDRDQRQLAPVLAPAFEPRRLRGLGFGQRLAAKHMRNLVRVDRDQADRALGGERAEPLLHLRARQPVAAVADQLDRDQIAVLRIAGHAARNVELAAGLALVDRHQPSAVRHCAEDADLALARAVEHLDDAAGMTNGLAFLADLLGTREHAIADAGDFGRTRLARNVDAYTRRLAMCLRVPFGRDREQLAIRITPGDVGEHHGGQSAGVMQLLAPPLDFAFGGQLAQHGFQRGARIILEREGARDLAHAGLALVRANEGEQFLAARKGAGSFVGFFQDRGKLGPDRRNRQPGPGT